MANDRWNLVTGGLGFLGSHLVDALLARGERVRILDRRKPDTRHADVDYHHGCITDPEAVRSAMRGVNRVFHKAAKAGMWSSDPTEFIRINQLGSRIVFQAAEAEGVEGVVHTSAESVLKSRRRSRAPAPSPTAIDESIQLTLDDMIGPYCRGKFLAEQEAYAAAERGLHVVIVNPTMPIGPGDKTPTPPTRMILGFLNGQYPAVLDTALNVVDARDVAEGHLLAADRGLSGQRYLLGHVNVQLTELLAMLEDLSGRPMPKKRIPYPVAVAFAAMSELVSTYVTHRPPSAPLTGVRLARHSLIFDCTKARRDLGLRPRPLSTSLQDQIAWFQSEGLLVDRP